MKPTRLLTFQWNLSFNKPQFPNSYYGGIRKRKSQFNSYRIRSGGLSYFYGEYKADPGSLLVRSPAKYPSGHFNARAYQRDRWKPVESIPFYWQDARYVRKKVAEYRPNEGLGTTIRGAGLASLLQHLQVVVASPPPPPVLRTLLRELRVHHIAVMTCREVSTTILNLPSLQYVEGMSTEVVEVLDLCEKRLLKVWEGLEPNAFVAVCDVVSEVTRTELVRRLKDRIRYGNVSLFPRYFRRRDEVSLVIKKIQA